MLLAAPNFSEGRDPEAIEAIAAAFAKPARRRLDLHSDPVHNRSVVTIAAEPGRLRGALLAGARACVERIDMREHSGAHPCVGALDVCPVVWLAERNRDAACEEARATGARLAAELELPVFFYGELAASPQRRERSHFRRGGLAGLRRRMEEGGTRPDLGPPAPHPSAGAVLVSARPPLAAFNVELSSGGVELARLVASRLREGGGGPAGVRAIGVELEGGIGQVSTNINDPVAVPLGAVVERVRELAAAHGSEPTRAELVGLVPEAGLRGYPPDVPIRGFDPDLRVIERLLELAA